MEDIKLVEMTELEVQELTEKVEAYKEKYVGQAARNIVLMTELEYNEEEDRVENSYSYKKGYSVTIEEQFGREDYWDIKDKVEELVKEKHYAEKEEKEEAEKEGDE